MEIRDVLAALEEEAAAGGVPIIRAAEREALIRAAAEARPRRILEIGTAIGYSALLLAECFPEAAVDTVELDEKRRARAQRAVEEAGAAGRVRCLAGDAAEVIPRLTGPYDFLYLDGPKGQYLAHLRLAEPLLSDRAVIAADNVLFRGLVRAEGPVPHRYRTIVTRLRDYIAYAETHYDTEIDTAGDGLAVSRRRKDNL